MGYRLRMHNEIRDWGGLAPATTAAASVGASGRGDKPASLL